MKRLTVSERENLRKSIQRFTVKNPNSRPIDIVDHFVKEGYARATLFKNVKRCSEDVPIKDKKKSGRPSSWTCARRSRLKRLTNNRTGVSQIKLGLKFGVHQSTVSRQLRKQGIKNYRREKTPKYTMSQALEAQKTCRRLVNQLYRSGDEVAMDDEKYFELDGPSQLGNRRFYSDDKSECPDSVRFAGHAKFPVKILVWVAISARGISEPFIRKQRSCAINKDIYREECLEKRLLPFLHKHHSDFNYVFWPDKATSHYANANREWMDQYINYVSYNDNPTNVPQARPIETFWANLAKKVYADNYIAKNEACLTNRIKLKLKEFDQSDLQRLMRGVKTKLRSIADHGIFHYLKK